jgi:hypothetical protein
MASQQSISQSLSHSKLTVIAISNSQSELNEGFELGTGRVS